MMRNFTKMVVTAIVLTTTVCASAQERIFLRDQIAKSGVCFNVVLTQSNGDLAILGPNNYVLNGIPRSLSRALAEIKESGEEIVDIQMTEQGRWVILYGSNGITWNDIPKSLEEALRQYNVAGSRIISATFTDSGRWIVATADAFNASDQKLLEWLKEGAKEMGQLWGACVTETGCVALYSGGTRVMGEVPLSLTEALDKTTIDIYRLKIAGTAWFFADKKGTFNYSM